MNSCEAGSTDCHFTCPKGGTWFVCTSEPYFVGCCASDPCTNTTTPACPDLYPASFTSSIYDKISPNDCIDNPSTDWYTCSSTSPTFLGCCKSDPCSGGCPSDALLPAAWSTAAIGQFQLFLDGASIPTTTVGPSSTSISTSTSSATSISTSTSSATGVPSSKSSGLSSGAIVGIVIGGAVVLSIILGVLFLRRRYRRHRQSSAAGGGQRIFAGGYGAYNGPSSSHQDSHLGSLDPTVKYTSVQQVIPELHSDHAPRRSEIYELDGIRR